MVRIYKVTVQGLGLCCKNCIEDIKVLFEEANIGEIFEVQVLEMTKEEYDALPEFMGF